MPYFGSLSFFAYFFYFLIAVFLAWYIPGKVMLRKISLGTFEKNVLSVLLGLALWGWQGFIFGYLHLRILSYAYLFVFFILFAKNFHKPNLKALKKLHFDWIIIGIFTAGIFLQIIGVVFMGARFQDRIMICCGATPDNNLELSIVNEIVQRFPPFEPGMYGHPLQNYHYWSHLVLAELIRVFNLPLVTTVYQYGIVLFSFLFGFSLIAVSKILGMKKAFTRWLLFFAYLGGDAAFFIYLFQGKGLGFPFDAMEHAGQFFFNYPRAVSIIVFSGGLGLFLQWLKDKKLLTGILAAIVFGSVIGFKVYTGVFVLIGCVAYGLYLLLKKKFSQTLPLFLVGILSLIIYIPVNSNAGGLFYTGFWRSNDFIVLPGLQLSHLELAREIYEKGGNVIRVSMYEMLFTFLFILITFGSKLVGLFQTKKSLKLFPVEFHIFFLSGFFVSFILGMFFWQKVGGPNTFNFLVTILILGCFYSALAAYYWIAKLPRKIEIIAIVLLVLITIPRVINFTGQVFTRLSRSEIITNQEQSALTYLKNNMPSSAIYLADPSEDPGITHYSEYVSPYIPYMTQRLSFLSGEIDEMQAHGIYYEDKLAIAKQIYSSTDSAKVAKLLKDNKISYLYMPSSIVLPVATVSAKIKPVFDNGAFKIYKVIE